MPRLERKQIGPLDCLVVAPAVPRLNVVLCHGFGAPGDDLVPLAGHLLQEFPDLDQNVQFVFPAAPLSMSEYGIPGGRAWWMLDMEKLQEAIATGHLRDLRNDAPPDLPARRAQLTGLLQALGDQTNLPPGRLVLGGFSQGSMLAIDVALHGSEKPAGLIVWSGTLLNEDVWRPLAPILSGLPILQSHGQQDPILPFEAATWLREFFTESGARNEFLTFQGGHAIPQNVLDATGRLLTDLLEMVND